MNFLNKKGEILTTKMATKDGYEEFIGPSQSHWEEGPQKLPTRIRSSVYYKTKRGRPMMRYMDGKKRNGY